MFTTIASRNKPMNHGMLTLLVLVLKIKAEKTDTGIIQSARANFTVVAISRAWAPYLLAAPTTELVS